MSWRFLVDSSAREHCHRLEPRLFFPVGLLKFFDRGSLRQRRPNEIHALGEHPLVSRRQSETRRVIATSHDAVVNVDHHPVGERV